MCPPSWPTTSSLILATITCRLSDSKYLCAGLIFFSLPVPLQSFSMLWSEQALNIKIWASLLHWNSSSGPLKETQSLKAVILSSICSCLTSQHLDLTLYTPSGWTVLSLGPGLLCLPFKPAHKLFTAWNLDKALKEERIVFGTSATSLRVLLEKCLKILISYISGKNSKESSHVSFIHHPPMIESEIPQNKNQNQEIDPGTIQQ